MKKIEKLSISERHYKLSDIAMEKFVFVAITKNSLTTC